MDKLQIGIKENLLNFTLLVFTNFFVGSMVGLERTILPIIGEKEFGISSASVALSFIISFGFSKAIVNYFAGPFAEFLGRKNVLLIGWGIGLFVPLMIIFATSWWMVIVANIVKPGSGIDKGSLTKSDLSGVTNTAKNAQDQGVVDTITGIFPSNIFESLAAGDILPVIFFSILFGLGLSSLGKKGEPLLQIFQTIGDTMFWITNKIMKLAPLGVFALIGVTISKFGLSSLLPLGKLVLTSYGVMIIFSVLVFGLVLKICHVNPIDFIKVLKNEIILAFSTASSEVVLPNLIKK